MRRHGKGFGFAASALAALPLAGFAAPALAAVDQFVIEKTSPMAGGYELLEGHYTGTLDPKDKHNAIIADLKLAPRNKAGTVDYYATFAIAKPTDMSKASGLLVYDIPNRGNGKAQALGDGHVDVISGWQGDVDEAPGAQFLRAPVAPVTGPAYMRFMNAPSDGHMMPAGTTTIAVSGVAGDRHAHGFEVATAKGSHLYTGPSDDRPKEQMEVPRSDWAFADCTAKPFPGTPDLHKICVKGGFDPKLAYTLTFIAKNPKVLGAGFAANRDLVAFLKYADKDAAGDPNPLAGKMRWAIARGESQSGDYLRTYINLGFNTAESGKIVFDGANPLISQRSISMNYRFSAPGGLVGLYELGNNGVNWWGEYDDKVRGLGRHSLLDRCHAAGDCPKITEILGAAELRYHQGSMDFVGTDAKADIPLPANVRRYYSASVTHGGGPGGFSLTPPAARNGACVLPNNPNPTSFVNRAIFAALVDWVTKDKAPPPSAYPTLAAGQLETHEVYDAHFPAIPGAPRPPYAPLQHYDFSKDPHFVARDVSGYLSVAPPRYVGGIALLVPRADADGNEMDGIRSPLLQAPLGTYLGWNVTASDFWAGRYCQSTGAFIPFAKTKAERMAKGDPRLSLEERYPSHDAYVAKVKAAADGLVAQGYMLPEDASKTVAQAQAFNW